MKTFLFLVPLLWIILDNLGATHACEYRTSTGLSSCMGRFGGGGLSAASKQTHCGRSGFHVGDARWLFLTSVSKKQH